MRARRLDLGITTADAGAPCVSYDGGMLVVRFADWQAAEREIRFVDAVAFRWEAPEDRAVSWDAIYVIEGSAWAARQTGEAVLASDDVVHYRLGFNACDFVLDVAARTIIVER